MEAIRKFLDLLPKERLILVQAWLLLLLADFALRTLPFKHVLALTQKNCLKGQEPSTGTLPPSVERLAWLMDVAGRYSLVTATCLKQALVLSWLLGRKGLATNLQIGVARHHDTVTAHAWLEQDGKVIFGQTGGRRYEPLLRT